jgi:hypothetical protein
MDSNALNNVLNLTPGNEVEFLGLTWRFLLPKEKLADNILFAPAHLCDSSINPHYIRDAYSHCPYKIVIYCARDEQKEKRPPKPIGMSIPEYAKVPKQKISQKNISGVIGIIFAKPHLDGIYISIVCSTTFVDGKSVPTKLGLILQTTMLNYATNVLGFKNAYNHAANLQLVKYYRKLGWVLTNQICGVNDELSLKFLNAGSDAELNELLNSFEVSLIKVPSGFPMRLCNINMDELFQILFKDFSAVYPKIVEILEKQTTLCLPKINFSEALVDEFDTNENTRRFDKNYDITSVDDDDY